MMDDLQTMNIATKKGLQQKVQIFCLVLTTSLSILTI